MKRIFGRGLADIIHCHVRLEIQNVLGAICLGRAHVEMANETTRNLFLIRQE